MYQQINLSDHSLVGTPGPLPANLVGLPDSAVADISAACSPPPPGMEGQGWWPVLIAVPTYDLRRQALTDPASFSADVSTRTVRGTQGLRDLTTDEIAALPPRVAAGDALIAALSDAQASAVKQRDLLRIAARERIPETSTMIARAAGKAGITVTAWFDAALAAS